MGSSFGDEKTAAAALFMYVIARVFRVLSKMTYGELLVLSEPIRGSLRQTNASSVLV